MATALPTFHQKLQALQCHVNAKIRALQLSPPWEKKMAALNVT